jgi:hypothetical protein
MDDKNDPDEDEDVEELRATKLSVAYHEAGHAVIGMRLGREIGYAKIYTEPPLTFRGMVYGEWHECGYVTWSDPNWKLKHDNRSIRGIMCSQAGEIAQSLCPDPFERQTKWSGDQDLRRWRGDQSHIRGMALKACKRDEAKAIELIARLHRRTEKLVQDNRAAIERVANALMKHRYLTGDEIKGVLGELEWNEPSLTEIPYTPELKALYRQTEPVRRI